MFDAHNHLTDNDAIKCTSELLPQYVDINQFDITKVNKSEIGLDKRFFERISRNKQIELITDELLYAKEKKIPVTLHCVQCTKYMIDVLQNVAVPHKYVLWHGFNGSVETAEILFKLGVIISIGPKYNKNTKELFAINKSIVLESDYTGTSQEEHDRILTIHYNNISAQTGIGIDELSETGRNETKAFKNRIIVG